MYTIQRILGENLLLNYEVIRNELQKALEYSDGDRNAAQIILDSISNPQIYQIWGVYKDSNRVALGSTRVVKYAGFRALHIITLAGETDGDLCEWAAIFEKEMEEQCVQIKDLSSGNQQSAPFDSIIPYLKSLK